MFWLCLHLPQLPLDVLSRGSPAAEPRAVIRGEGPGSQILLCNSQAAALGVRPGLPVGAAHALAEGLRVHARDEAAERAALEGVAAWAGEFTSLVSLAPPCAVLLEVGGSLALFGGEQALTQKVRAGLAALGYHTRLALAPTPLGATLLTRAGCDAFVLKKSALTKALGPLPLAVLEPEAGEFAALRAMGVRTLGDCLRLPRDGLARRFGPRLLQVLDRALGRRPDPRPPFEPPPRFDSRLLLPVEVSEAEALLFAARRLVLELCGMLRSRGGGVQSLVLRLFHRAQAVTPIPLGLVAPSRDAQHLLGLLRERLERVQLIAPVREVGLAADAILPLDATHLDLFGGPGAPGMAPAALIERLRARLGDEAVQGLCLAPEHRPERAWRYCAPGASGPAAAFGPRPLWLLAEPVPLEAVSGGPDLAGRLALEREHERIESGWWDGGDVRRDYFVARDKGGARLWLFREGGGRGRWFLHGIFD